MNFDKVPELPDRPVKPTRRVSRGWLGAGLLLLAGAVAYLAVPRHPGQSPEQARRAEQIATLAAQVRALKEQVAALAPDAPGRRRLLEQGVARQGELMRLREPPDPADSLALDDWQSRLNDAVAEENEMASRTHEATAADYRRQGRTADAAEQLREALRLQREVNRSPSLRQAKNLGREALLQRQIEELVAGPLAEEGRRAEAEARVAADAGRWEEALRLYDQAREARRRVNADFPRSRYADSEADARIATAVFALVADEVQAKLGQSLQEAAAAAAAGRWEEGDRLYGEAAQWQRELNTRFPNSRYVSMEQLERIEVERQTLRLMPRLAELHALDARIAGHLRRREVFQAQQLIRQALAAVEDAVRLFPKAREFDETLRERLNYLARHADDLGTIQDATYELLAPLPRRTGVALLRTELPQELFARVMSTNPSREPGRAQPVDSVTWAEAAEFCRRLGWMLGVAVRLPSAAECGAAAGDPGFKDLAGGLGEWLATDGDGPVAPLLGADGTAGTAPRAERVRTTGFRIAAEVDLLAAPAK